MAILEDDLEFIDAYARSFFRYFSDRAAACGISLNNPVAPGERMADPAFGPGVLRGYARVFGDGLRAGTRQLPARRR